MLIPVSKREIWSIKVDQVITDYKSLRESIDNYFTETARKQEAQNQLHQRRQSSQSQIEDQIYIGDSLSRTQQIADGVNEIIGNLRIAVKDQNITMKRIKRQLLDLTNQFELSRSLLHKIETYMTHDKIILFGGMTFILLLLFWIWWFVK